MERRVAALVAPVGAAAADKEGENTPDLGVELVPAIEPVLPPAAAVAEHQPPH